MLCPHILAVVPSSKCHKTPTGVLDLQTDCKQRRCKLGFYNFSSRKRRNNLLMHSILVLIHILHLHVHQYNILGGVGHVTNMWKVTDPKTYVTR